MSIPLKVIPDKKQDDFQDIMDWHIYFGYSTSSQKDCFT
jgi:hypothetical protein